MNDLETRVRAGEPDAIRETIARLDRGELRVAEKVDGEWRVNAWVKEAILGFFRISSMETMEVGPFEFHDKIPLKRNLAAAGVRVVPPGVVRYGAFVERGAIGRRNRSASLATSAGGVTIGDLRHFDGRGGRHDRDSQLFQSR